MAAQSEAVSSQILDSYYAMVARNSSRRQRLYGDDDDEMHIF